MVGLFVGDLAGGSDGWLVGNFEGSIDGNPVGLVVGVLVGDLVGISIPASEEVTGVGLSVRLVGSPVGVGVGWTQILKHSPSSDRELNNRKRRSSKIFCKIVSEASIAVFKEAMRTTKK